MENPWTALPMSAPYVLPSDAEYVTAFNESPRVSERRHLRLDVLPEPYIGRINAPIVFLKLNPGYTPSDICFTEDEDARQVWQRNVLHRPLDYPFYVVDPALSWADNAKWWRAKIRRVIALFDEKVVANNVLCIESFLYHSYGKPRFPGMLPSQTYSLAMVNQAIDHNAV